MDLADACSQRSQKEDVPNDLVYRTQSLLTLGTRVFFPHGEGYAGVGRTPKPRAARLQFKSFQGGLL